MKKTQISPPKMSNYISAKSKITSGRHEGPVLVEGRAAKLTLRHPAIKDTVPSIHEWELDACYIKLAPRKTQKKSYIAFAFDGETCKSMCVESRQKEEGNNLVLRFILTRVGIDAGNRLCSDSAEPTDQTVQQESSEQLDEDIMSSLNITCAERMDSSQFEGTESPPPNRPDQEEPPEISLAIQTYQEEDHTPQDSNEADDEIDTTDEELDYDDSDHD